MATLDRYYTSPNDVDLAKDMVAKRSDIYVQKFEYIGSGVLDDSTPATATLTPATSPSWTEDAYNSLYANNLYIVDDDGKVASTIIDDTSATAITFDSTSALLEEDGATPATFTDTATYDFYVLTPCSVAGQVDGPFFGYTEEVSLNISDEVMRYKYSQPAKLVRSDLKERTGSLEGASMNTTNEDMIATLFGADTYGDQTSGFSYGVGSNNEFDKFYRITFVSEDVTGRKMRVVCRRVQMFLNGGMFKPYQDGHLGTPFKGEITADLFYPETANMVWIDRAA